MDNKFIIILVLTFFLFACEQEKKGISKKDNLDSDTATLAKAYCSSCHLYPSPDLLPKDKWPEVLEAMKPLMGLYKNPQQRDSLLTNNSYLKNKFLEFNTYPESPMVSDENYSKIFSYYLQNSPESQSYNVPIKQIPTTLSLFDVVEPEQKVKIPSTTMARIKNDQLFIGDANTKSLSVFNSDLKLLQSANVDEGAVHLNFFDNVTFVTVMGSFSPTDLPLGRLIAIDNATGKFQTILDSLQRPVKSEIDDINNDGLPDIVVCEYGNLTGQLSVFWNKGNNQFEKQVLRKKSGSISAFIKDINNDGKKDIVALFAQADEGIWKFINKGNKKFESRSILRFPSIYGSAYINYYDFDKDGKAEIIYCNGDNADLSIISKPYHGIRIFKEINNKWKETFFFQLNGAYKAIPYDYDIDGDIDLAVISFFPDYDNNPNESFVFLENDGKMNFKASTFKDAARGRWLTMDIGDLDLDGDADLVLGPLTLMPKAKGDWVEKWMKNGLPFLFLKNKTK